MHTRKKFGLLRYHRSKQEKLPRHADTYITGHIISTSIMGITEVESKCPCSRQPPTTFYVLLSAIKLVSHIGITFLPTC